MVKTASVAFIFTSLWNKTGLFASVRKLAKGLANQGYDVEYISGINMEPEYLEKNHCEGFKVIQISSLKKKISPIADIKAFFKLYRIFRQRRYDIVHTFIPKAGILGRWAAYAAGVPVIIHGVYGTKIAPTIPYKERFTYWLLDWITAKITNYLTFNSQELQQEYNRAGIGRPSNSLLQYVGHDFSALRTALSQRTSQLQMLRQQHGLVEENIVLGYVARIVPAKGHIYAIRAYKELVNDYPNLRFLIVGDAWNEEEKYYKKVLEEEVETLGLAPYVKFLGYVPHIEPYYNLFDILVFPSLHEGLPLVLIEAKAMGLPVISFDIGGVREVLAEGDTLVPVGDVDGLAQALRNAIRKLDSDRSSRLARVQDLTPWEMRFSTAKMIDSTAHLYARLLGQSSH